MCNQAGSGLFGKTSEDRVQWERKSIFYLQYIQFEITAGFYPKAYFPSDT